MLGRIKSCIANAFNKVRKNKWVRRVTTSLLVLIGIKALEVLCEKAYDIGFQSGQECGYVDGAYDVSVTNQLSIKYNEDTNSYDTVSCAACRDQSLIYDKERDPFGM